MHVILVPIFTKRGHKRKVVPLNLGLVVYSHCERNRNQDKDKEGDHNNGEQ